MATKHFTDAELACRCGCGALPPVDFQQLLERFREFYMEPIRISSAARCPDHNARVSKTGRHGPHTIAAVDIACSGHEAFALLGAAMRFGRLESPWWGIGVHQRGPHAQRFIHLDILEHDAAHPRPWVWSY